MITVNEYLHEKWPLYLGLLELENKIDLSLLKWLCTVAVIDRLVIHECVNAYLYLEALGESHVQVWEIQLNFPNQILEDWSWKSENDALINDFKVEIDDFIIEFANWIMELIKNNKKI